MRAPFAIDPTRGALVARLPVPGPFPELVFAGSADAGPASMPVGLGGWCLPIDHRLDVGANAVLLGGRRRAVARPRAEGDRLIVDRVSSRQRLVFDETGRLLEIRDHPGVLVRWWLAWNGGRLAAVGDARRRRLTVTAHGDRLTVSGGGRRAVIGLDARGLLTSLTADDGRAWHVAYDDRARPTTIVRRVGTGSTGEGDEAEQRFEASYDEEGLVRLDEPGRRTDVVRTVDGARRRISLVRSTGEESSVELAPLEGGGRLETRRCCGSPVPYTVATHPDGSQVVSEADGSTVTRRVVRTGGHSPVWGTAAGTGSQRVEMVRRTPSGRTTIGRRWVEEHTDGSVEEVHEVDGQRRRRWTSADGRRTESTSAAGRRSVLTLDDRGRAATASASSGLAVRNHYDEHGRLTAQTTGATTLTYRYGDDGLVTVDDGHRQLTVIQDQPGGSISSLLADGRRVVVARSEDRRRVDTTVDGNARWSLRRRPDGDVEALLPGPDGDGALRPALRWTTDDAGRLLGYDEGVGPITLRRDAGGQLVGLAGSSVEIAIGRDAAGRVDELTTGAGSAARIERDGPLVTAYTSEGHAPGRIEFDYDGFAHTATTIGPVTLARSVDADGLVTAEGPAQFIRHPTTGLVTRLEVGRVVIAFRHDEHGRVVARTVSVAGDDRPIAHLADTFDDVNRAVAGDEIVGEERRTTTRTYGPTGRLLAVEVDGAPSWAAQWDDLGNRTVTHHLADDRPDVHLRVDGGDRLLSVGQDRARYDEADRLTQLTGPSGTITFHHDDLGRLVAVRTAEGQLVQHTVDGFGRRTATYVDGEYRQGYLWAGARLAATLGPDATLDTVFVPGAGRTPVAMIRHGRTYALVADRLGSIRLTIDADTGEVVRHCRYDPDGRTEIDTNPGFHHFGFTGGLVDGVTDLVLLGARTYHPGLARWISRDPLLMTSGQHNLHTYASGDPANRIDPTGLQDLSVDYNDGGASDIPEGPAICAWDFGHFEHGMICNNGRCFGTAEDYRDDGGIMTKLVDQTDRARLNDTLKCEELEDVDTQCLQDWIDGNVGTSTGYWGVDADFGGANICWNPVFEAARACGGDGYQSVPTESLPDAGAAEIYRGLDRLHRSIEWMFE
ncbi:MAG: RHS repeat-associated core domain-containing protein [Actinomycetota bacterium]